MSADQRRPSVANSTASATRSATLRRRSQSLTRMVINMADTKSGSFSKTVQKKAGRAKERVSLKGRVGKVQTTRRPFNGVWRVPENKLKMYEAKHKKGRLYLERFAVVSSLFLGHACTCMFEPSH